MKKAIILFSGGLDSTVVLAMALQDGLTCHTLSFDYGQKHKQELMAAKQLAAYYNVSHQIIRIDPSAFGSSSLVSDVKVPCGRSFEQMVKGGIPSTYVPARNTLFLAYALGQCELHEANEIHFGPNGSDAPCYPDCRPSYLQAFQSVMNQATKQAIEGSPPRLVTPLLHFDKKEIIRRGNLLKVPFEMTWSCYSPVNDRPCHECDACRLRAEGFAKT